MVKKIHVRVGHAPSVTSLSMKIFCKGYRPLRGLSEKSRRDAMFIEKLKPIDLGSPFMGDTRLVSLLKELLSLIKISFL